MTGGQKAVPWLILNCLAYICQWPSERIETNWFSCPITLEKHWCPKLCLEEQFISLIECWATQLLFKGHYKTANTEEKSGPKTALPWSCFGKRCHFGGWSHLFPKYCHGWSSATYHEMAPGVEPFWFHFFFSVKISSISWKLGPFCECRRWPYSVSMFLVPVKILKSQALYLEKYHT